MALKWDMTRVSQSTPHNGVSKTLIYCTMLVAMPDITQDNAAEFFARVHFYEKLYGALMQSVDENNDIQHVPMELSHVEAHIGLRTNANSESWTQYARRITSNWHREHVHAVPKSQKRVAA